MLYFILFNLLTSVNLFLDKAKIIYRHQKQKNNEIPTHYYFH